MTRPRAVLVVRVGSDQRAACQVDRDGALTDRRPVVRAVSCARRRPMSSEPTSSHVDNDVALNPG